MSGVSTRPHSYPTMLLAQPVIALPEVKQDEIVINDYHYSVILKDGVRHFIYPEWDDPYSLTCSCNAGCEAITIVENNLLAGGKTAPLPPPGYFPHIPAKCPICGKAVKYALNLSSPQRGKGWICIRAGVAHYWETQGKILPSLRQQVCHGCDGVHYPHRRGSGGCTNAPLGLV